MYLLQLYLGLFFKILPVYNKSNIYIQIINLDGKNFLLFFSIHSIKKCPINGKLITIGYSSNHSLEFSDHKEAMHQLNKLIL